MEKRYTVEMAKDDNITVIFKRGFDWRKLKGHVIARIITQSGMHRVALENNGYITTFSAEESELEYSSDNFYRTEISEVTQFQ